MRAPQRAPERAFWKVARKVAGMCAVTEVLGGAATALRTSWAVWWPRLSATTAVRAGGATARRTSTSVTMMRVRVRKPGTLVEPSSRNTNQGRLKEGALTRPFRQTVRAEIAGNELEIGLEEVTAMILVVICVVIHSARAGLHRRAMGGRRMAATRLVGAGGCRPPS